MFKSGTDATVDYDSGVEADVWFVVYDPLKTPGAQHKVK